MEKQFECEAFLEHKLLSEAAYIGFCVRIEDGNMTQQEAEALFAALEIGETLVDEDGDTWERIA